jgi:hypothetical protein
VRGEALPHVAFELTLVVHLELVEINEPTGERRQLRFVAAHLAIQETMIAGRCHDRAGDAAVFLREDRDSLRIFTFAGQSYIPPSSQVGVVAGRVLVKAVRLAAHRLEGNVLFLAAGLDERHGAFDAIAIERRA